ncbi:hypothetical protein V1527DRAFT_45868 [Lipomyces starkeyi]
MFNCCAFLGKEVCSCSRQRSEPETVRGVARLARTVMVLVGYFGIVICEGNQGFFPLSLILIIASAVKLSGNMSIGFLSVRFYGYGWGR